MGYDSGEKKKGLGELVDFPRPHPPISKMVHPTYRSPARMNKECLTKFNIKRKHTRDGIGVR